MKYSDNEIEKILKGIHDGTYTEDNLPEDLYFDIADYLKRGLYKGFGGDLEDFDGADLELLTEFRDNIYIFSAAKTFQEVRAMSDMLADEDGNIRPFKEFKEAAGQIFEDYNETYLAAEYQTAVGMAQIGAKWNGIEKDKEALPYLQYSAVGGACDICGPLDGLVAPVDDAVWDTKTPLNHFNCRCLIIQLDDSDGKASLTPDDEKDEINDSVGAKMDAEFKMNPGKDKVIFSSDHPYFDIDKKDKSKAENNFGLPIPDKD